MMDDNARRAQPMDADEMMREVMVTSALQSAAFGRGQIGLGRDRIILSCKMSRACRT